MNFSVYLDEVQHGSIALRLEYDCAKLQLDRRMAVRSANVLVELQRDLEEHLADLGVGGLKVHFTSEAAKRYARHGNTLKVTAYRAASVNDAFCAGEYKNESSR